MNYQTYGQKDQEKAPHQKIKIYSSNKRRKDHTSSNKSSPAQGQSSHQRQQVQKETEVDTNPFTTTVDHPIST